MSGYRCCAHWARFFIEKRGILVHTYIFYLLKPFLFEWGNENGGWQSIGLDDVHLIYVVYYLVSGIDITRLHIT